MATNICPNCGTPAGTEARFCRTCGASLKNVGAEENYASPLASTIPLTDFGRTTDHIAAADPQGRAPETARVQTGEIKELLEVERRNDGQEKTSSTHEPFDPEATLVRDPSAVAAVPATSALSTPDQRGALVNYAETIPSVGVQNAPASASPYERDGQPSQTTRPNVVARQEAVKSRGGRWWQWAIVGASLLVAAIAIFLVARSLNRPAPSNSNSVQVEEEARPMTISERLTEGERLLAAGEVEAAIKGLREAVALDPANSEARRLLGDALLQNGKRAEAIEEYRQAALNDPQNKAVWAKLASAQFAEGLYAEAAESYERLAALAGDTGLGEEVQLQRADALRLAGRNAEAKAIYTRLTASSSTGISENARARLVELSAREARPSPTATTEQARNGETVAPQSPAAPTPATTAPSPPPPPPPANNDPFARGEALWRQNRAAAVAEFRRAAAAGNADAYYYLGLNIAEGRDPKTLPRAELLAALQYFQNARARSNRFRAQAREYELRLDAEYGQRLGQQ